jgi:hypothetical protein
MLLLAVAVVFMLMGGAAYARSEEDCAAAWAAADTNRDGFITADEGGRYHAALGAQDKSIADGKLSRRDFMEHCQAGLFDLPKTDAAAPLKGANSFTESEAKNRVLARGYRNVSSLQKDADGIWRGTAELNGTKVNVAVDYKGNVVSKYP